MFTQLLDGYIFAYFHPRAYLHTYLTHDVDFGLDDLFVQFIGGYTVLQHTTRNLVLLEHSGFIAYGSQIIGTTQTSGTATDNGDFLFPVLLYVGTDIHLRHKAGIRLQILLCNELLHRINGYRLVNSATCASILATAVAHATAHCRKWILALNQFQSFGIFAFGGFLQIALHSDMGRTSGLARCCARRITVDTVLITIILIPFMGTPLAGIRQFLLGIGLFAMFSTQLLPQSDGSGRTVFHTASTSHTTGRIHFRHISTTRQIRSVK